MPFWFFDKKKSRPDIYGSLRAISQDTDIKEITLQNHYSKPIGADNINRMINMVKKLQKYVDNGSKIKPKSIENVFSFNQFYKCDKIFEVEIKLYKYRQTLKNDLPNNHSLIFKPHVLEATESDKIVKLVDEKLVTVNFDINSISANNIKLITKTLTHYIKLHKYSYEEYCLSNIIIKEEVLVDIFNELIGVLNVEIESFEKEYHTTYTDERYEIHKKDIKRTGK